MFTLHLVWPSNINERSTQSQIYALHRYTLTHLLFRMSVLFWRKAWEYGSCSRMTHTSFLPPLCVLRWAGLHPHWEWKAWLTPSLSSPAAPGGAGRWSINIQCWGILSLRNACNQTRCRQAGLRRWKPLKHRTRRLLSISSQTFGVICGIRLPAVWALKIFFTILWALEYIIQNYSVIGGEDRFLLGMYIFEQLFSLFSYQLMYAFMCILLLFRWDSSILYMIINLHCHKVIVN